jgi:tRNA A-37 threonylcarbamoyl transferase component Bud32/membrane-associated phospholipid phosphatase
VRAEVTSGGDERTGERLLERAGGRRRRPSGEPPPMPRELGRSGRFWLGMVVYLFLSILGVLLFDPMLRWFEGLDTAVLRVAAELRVSVVHELADVVNLLASRWTIRLLRWSVILALIVFRRWRHLVVFVGTLVVLEVVTYQTSLYLSRPRPFSVEMTAPWQGFAMPSRPVASLAVTLVSILYTVVPQGALRDRGKWIVGVVVGTLIVARIVLGVDHPTSALAGAVFGVALGLAAFRLFTPNDVFPVTYRRGKTAHLDVGGRRGEAIVAAVEEQLGERVVDIRPIGLEGSGGSTPVLLTIEREDGSRLQRFAKVYSITHVRADRWYKLGRTILYGALEDETPFGTVRRFVEYEDYALRLLRDEGLPGPEPGGVVEITPEREYMIVMEFFDGAVEIGEAEVDEAVIDEGLDLIRRMWDIGIAHRDIKPANLMVYNGHLKVIDVFFVQVRPSPWRQAVDLANMMLVLALRSDAETVYERALRVFTPDDIAEAFAATRGVASPTQLRAMLKDDERDLAEEFRRLAPDRRPIRIQRWSLRRLALTVWVAALGAIGLVFVVGNWAVFA